MIATQPKLTTCDWCAGTGGVPNEFHSVETCPKCLGGKWNLIAFDLGATRTYQKGRPCLWNPGTGNLVATRNGKPTEYRVIEYEPDPLDGYQGRAFTFGKLNRFGTCVVETYHVYVGKPGTHKCTCTGFLAEASEKADKEAWKTGGVTHYQTWGCLHLDAALKLVWDELIPKSENLTEVV